MNLFSRRNHEAVDRALEDLQAVIDEPIMQEKVGTAIVSLWSSYLRDFYVPNVRGDSELVTPKKHAKNPYSLPIIGAARGETLHSRDAHIASFTPFQEKKVIEKLQRWGLPEGVASRLDGVRPDDQPCSFTLGENAHATVTSFGRFFRLNEVHDSKSVHPRSVSMRPITVVNSEGGSRFAGATMVHEVMHILDFEAEPIRVHKTSGRDVERGIDRSKVAYELKAYHMEAIILDGLFHHARNPLLRRNNALGTDTPALSIDSLREKENEGAKDPFRVTTTLIREIGNIGLDF